MANTTRTWGLGVFSLRDPGRLAVRVFMEFVSVTMFGIELLVLLLSVTALAAEVHWERVPADGPVRDIAVVAERDFVARFDDGRLMSIGDSGWMQIAPATPTSRSASGVSSSAGGVWVIDGESAYAQRFDGEWQPRIQVPVAFPTNVSTDGQGRIWASGLHGTLAVHERGEWSVLDSVEGNVHVEANTDGAWVWTTDSDGQRLRLDGRGLVLERGGDATNWANFPHSMGASDGVVYQGGADGLRVDGKIVLDGIVNAAAATAAVAWAVDETGTVWRIVDGAAEETPAPERLWQLAASNDEAWGLTTGGTVYRSFHGVRPAFRDETESWGGGVIDGHVAVADLDGDGDDDVITWPLTGTGSPKTWLQTHGHFVPGPSFPHSENGVLQVVAACDFDGNGLVDPVALTGVLAEGARPQLVLNRGRFDDVTSRAGISTDSEFRPMHLDCGDIDGDGDDDLWFVRGGLQGTTSVWLYLNDGLGFFTRAKLSDRSLDQPDYVRALHPADLDGDGAVDVVVINHWGRGHNLLAGDASGRLRDVSVASGLRTVYDVIGGSALIDYDGDRSLDLITWGEQAVNVWRGSGLRFAGATPDRLAAETGLIGAALIGGARGGSDIVVCGGLGCRWHDLQSGLSDRGLSMPPYGPNGRPTSIDLGADGDDDLIIVGKAGTALWENRGEASAPPPAARHPFGLVRRLRWMQPSVDGIGFGAVGLAWLFALVATRRVGSSREAGSPLVALGGLAVWCAGWVALADQVPLVRTAWAVAWVAVAVAAQAASVVLARARQTQRVANYRLGARIGAGGMGTVYVATEEGSGETVALKLVNPDMLLTEDDRLMYRREAEMGASIEHNGVVQIHAFGECTVLEDSGESRLTAWLAMELLDGESLEQHIERRGPLPVGEAVAIVAAVCDALAAIHQLDVVHRDIKPANVMLVPDGLETRVVLMDFGAARHVGQLTEGTRSVLGTVGYLAPEQGQGKPPMPQADVYACGVLLYQLLSGRRPFDAADLISLMVKVLSEPPPPLEVEVPEALEALVGRALEKDPEQRVRSARALREALLPWAGRIPRPARRRVPLLRGSAPQSGVRQAAQVLWRYVRGARTDQAPPTITAPGTES